jgi:hypothetical protein
MIIMTVANKQRSLDEAMPEVGMGPSWKSLVDQALEECNVTKDEIDYETLVAS